MKEFLSQNGVPFANRDLENDPGAADEARALGVKSAPATVADGRVVSGFSPREIAELLGLEVEAPVLDPGKTLPIIERALGAVVEAVKQMPAELRDLPVPGRPRPLRELTHHMFTVVSRTVEDLRTSGAAAGRETARPPGARFQEIADYGNTVVAQFRGFAAGVDPDSLRAPPPAGSNAKNGAERLDLLAGRTVHHLRQLYDILEKQGISPVDRVPDSAWPPQYVLSNLW